MAAARALDAAGHRVIVTTTGGPSLAAASRSCHGHFVTPRADDGGYADAVRQGAAAAGASVVLAASDAALLALGEDVAGLVDKEELARRAADVRIPVPPTERFDTVDDLVAAARAGGVRFPSVVKPVVSRAPAARVDTIADVERLADLGPTVVQPFLSSALWSLAGVIVQGRAVAAVQQRYLRTWPVDCGTASAAVTAPVDHGVLDRLTALLSGRDGIFQAQFAGESLLDVNPRVYGSMGLAVASGANLPAIWVAWAADGTVPHRTILGRPGVPYRWLEGDVRHVLTRLRRDGVRAVPTLAAAARPRRGSAHSVESLRDPRPLLVRLSSAVRGTA